LCEFLVGRNEFHAAKQLQLGDVFLSVESEQRLVEGRSDGVGAPLADVLQRNEEQPLLTAEVNDHIRPGSVARRFCLAARHRQDVTTAQGSDSTQAAVVRAEVHPIL